MNRWVFSLSRVLRLEPRQKSVQQLKTWRSSELEGLLVRLNEAKLALEEAGGFESQFLTTATEFECLAKHGDEFVKEVEKLVGLATGKDCNSSVFTNAIGIVEDSMGFLDGCQLETGRILHSLRGYHSQIDQLLEIELELQRAMLPLKFIQTLFRVESAPLGAATQQMFIALTQQIEGLHAQVRDIFGTKFKQLDQTRNAIGQVVRQLERQLLLLEQTTSKHKVRIGSSLTTLKEEMALNQERDLRLGRLSKNLSKEVGEAVMGLQFQDIVSQKLHHVTSRLPEIEGKIEESNLADDVATASEPLQFVHQSCDLEAGQIQSAMDELAKAENSISSAIEKVQDQMKEMDSDCLSLEEFRHLTTSFDGMVQVLIESIESVREIVAATVASSSAAFEMLKPLGCLASDLTTYVRQISSQIHLMGLNAQVQAALTVHDQRGAGLEVLSSRLSEISSETNRISEQASTKLDQLAAGLTDSVQAFGKLRADGLVQQEKLNHEGCSEEKALHAFRDEALETLHKIGDSFECIREQAVKTAATVQFGEFYQVTLPALKNALLEISRTTKDWLTKHGCGITEASMLDGFKRDYTMESERAVFEKIVSVNRDGGPTAPKLVASHGRDFEMFDEMIPETSAEEILPVTDPRKPEIAVPSVSEGAGLGDNVELF